MGLERLERSQLGLGLAGFNPPLLGVTREWYWEQAFFKGLQAYEDERKRRRKGKGKGKGKTCCFLKSLGDAWRSRNGERAPSSYCQHNTILIYHTS